MLQLQESNLRVNLSDAEAADGFLSLRYTEEMFRRVNDELAIVVAVAEERLSGICVPNAFRMQSSSRC